MRKYDDGDKFVCLCWTLRHEIPNGYLIPNKCHWVVNTIENQLTYISVYINTWVSNDVFFFLRDAQDYNIYDGRTRDKENINSKNT